jgi:hypothetical protein
MLQRCMNAETLRFESLTDDQLLTVTKQLVACERTATAAVLRSLMEIGCSNALRILPATGLQPRFVPQQRVNPGEYVVGHSFPAPHAR